MPQHYLRLPTFLAVKLYFFYFLVRIVVPGDVPILYVYLILKWVVRDVRNGLYVCVVQDRSCKLCYFNLCHSYTKRRRHAKF